MRVGNRAAALAVLVGLLGLTAAPAADRAAGGARKIYTSRVSFSLPVRIDERDRAELRELKFYVKALQGARPGEWICLETAKPTKEKFSYQAALDGEYWFAFVTIDKAGHVAPVELDKEPPGLVVVVDTKAPEVDVQKLPVVSGEVYLQCQIKDANPDYAALKLEYRAPDKNWRGLEPLPDAPGVFRVPDAAVLRGTVRASAADKAGNQTVREIDLTREVAAAAPAPAPPPPPPSRAPAPPAPPAPAPAPVAPVASHVTEKPTEKPAAAPDAAPATRQLLNSNHCVLEYALDLPNVTKVEGYATRDGGKTWQKVGDDPDRHSPFEFDLPEDGVYGIALVLSTAGRPAQPPAAGDAPDWWVEIDTTRPVVQMTDIRHGTGDEAGQLILSWSALDKNLGPEAVELAWASHAEGPWHPAAKGMKNEGTARWPVPKEVGGRFFLRLEATDRAGNVGRWETREPIVLETARPKARVLGVSAGRP